jgi:hypothetical protein
MKIKVRYTFLHLLVQGADLPLLNQVLEVEKVYLISNINHWLPISSS